ncbi:unnamed protein product, partial [Mycena citricolor]
KAKPRSTSLQSNAPLHTNRAVKPPLPLLLLLLPLRWRPPMKAAPRKKTKAITIVPSRPTWQRRNPAPLASRGMDPPPDCTALARTL